MTHWDARPERIIRGDFGRCLHRRSEISRSTSSDERGQPILRKARAIHAGDCSLPTRDDALQLRIAEQANDGARSRSVRRPGERAVKARHDGDAVIVVLAGEFDLAMADPVREALDRAISESRRRLIVDLSEVTFIDSSGVHVILDAYKLCRDAEPTLTIRPGPPNVQQVFKLTNLLDYLPFDISG